MVVEEFKKLWLPVGVDFVVVRVLSADHCKYSSLPCSQQQMISKPLNESLLNIPVSSRAAVERNVKNAENE
jgi:hypothetical protein